MATGRNAEAGRYAEARKRLAEPIDLWAGLTAAGDGRNRMIHLTRCNATCSEGARKNPSPELGVTNMVFMPDRTFTLEVLGPFTLSEARHQARKLRRVGDRPRPRLPDRGEEASTAIHRRSWGSLARKGARHVHNNEAP